MSMNLLSRFDARDRDAMSLLLGVAWSLQLARDGGPCAPSALLEAVRGARPGAAGAPELLSRLRTLLPLQSPAARPEQRAALEVLAPLRRLSMLDREVTLARLVARIGGLELAEAFGLGEVDLAAHAASGLDAVAGPLTGSDWSAEPALLDPMASPPAPLLALENAVAPLVLDVTALDDRLPTADQPERPPPLLREPPPAHYPSLAPTRGVVDLPAAAQVVEREAVTAAPSQPDSDATEPRGRPLAVAPRPLPRATESAEPTVVKPAAPEHTPDPEVHTAPPPTRVARGRAGAVWWLAAAMSLVFAGALYWALIARAFAQTRGAWPLVPVLVATRDLGPGEVLTADHVARRDVPAIFASPLAVKPEGVELLLGQKLRLPMQAGDPLMWDHLEAAERRFRLSSKVHHRLRAFAVPINELNAVGGWLEPNDRADLVLTPSNGGERLTSTVLQDVPVLTVGAARHENRGRVKGTFSDITLLLAPEEAEAVSIAIRSGAMVATLRAPDDHDYVALGTTRLETLLEEGRRQVGAKRRATLIETIRSRPGQR